MRKRDYFSLYPNFFKPQNGLFDMEEGVTMEKEKQYTRIRINHSKENKAKGFYLLMTNGNTYSEKEDEFIVEKRFLELLTKNEVSYDLLKLKDE